MGEDDLKTLDGPVLLNRLLLGQSDRAAVRAEVLRRLESAAILNHRALAKPMWLRGVREAP